MAQPIAKETHPIPENPQIVIETSLFGGLFSRHLLDRDVLEGMTPLSPKLG